MRKGTIIFYKVEYKQTIPSDYKLVLKYMEQVRSRYAGEVTFICGYKAGCLGYDTGELVSKDMEADHAGVDLSGFMLPD